jgi:TatD DNase family protein
MATFYDTHAHLDYPDFAADIAKVIERAFAAGIAKVITIGTNLESSRRAIKLAEQYPAVYAAVGWHPTNVLEAPDDVGSLLRELAGHPKVVAIGETGLDYHHLPSEKPGATSADDERYKKKQVEIFRQQMELAAEFGLNCVVHQRSALEDTLTQMRPFVGRVRGVFHCFVDGPAIMQRIVSIGSIVSFTGIVTFKNAEAVRETVAAVPLDRFMLETDAPYLAPVPYRGKRCEPAYIREIAQVAAQLRKCSLDELSSASCATAQKFFPKLK